MVKRVKNDLLPQLCREIKTLIRKLDRGAIECLQVPALPANPPLPAGHFHTLPEIFIQTGGYTDFELPWTRFRLFAGQTGLIPPYSPHDESFYHHKKPFRYFVGMIRHDCITWHEGTLDGHCRFRHTSPLFCYPQENHRLVKLLGETAACGSRPGRYGKLQLRGAALLSFSALLEALETHRDNPHAEPPKIAFCKQYIHTHLNETSLCVKTLARLAECSPNYLSSLFHAHTGVRISDFLNTCRLERVKDLLVHSTMNISQAAHACGYDDAAYMTRRFVQAFHLSPRAYRIHYSSSSHSL